MLLLVWWFHMPRWHMSRVHVPTQTVLCLHSNRIHTLTTTWPDTGFGMSEGYFQKWCVDRLWPRLCGLRLRLESSHTFAMESQDDNFSYLGTSATFWELNYTAEDSVTSWRYIQWWIHWRAQKSKHMYVRRQCQVEEVLVHISLTGNCVGYYYELGT